MKLKDSSEITDLLYMKTIWDMEFCSDKEEDVLRPSELLLFVKDTHYEGDLHNKLSLIIVDKNSGYVVNNNFKFNSLGLDGRKITIYRMVNNKREESYYWFN